MSKTYLASALALTLALGATTAFADQAAPSGQQPSAQQPSGPPPAQQPPARAAQPAPIRGELVAVDTDAKSITVKPSEGPELKFSYDDKTNVTGAKDAAGLATMKDSRVTVHFTEDAKTKAKLATRIIVEPRQ